MDAVIFHNEENGYTVLLLAVEGEEEPITVVGCIPCAAAGEGMTVTGVWTMHPVHGAQLTAESVERRLPRSQEDMVAYLSSGIIKGIGPATAQRLVERFGDDTLDVLRQEPERLKCIKGITAKRAQELSEAFRALTGLRQIMEFLARYDLPVYLAMPLQRTYGDTAMQCLRDDPYILSRAQFGVDFAVADAIAISMGFGGDDPCRLRAAIEYELAHNAGNGHVFLPREKLLAATAKMVDVDTDMVETALDKSWQLLAVHRYIDVQELPQPAAPAAPSGGSLEDETEDTRMEAYKMKVVASSLNVRDEPDVKGRRIGRLNEGAIVTVQASFSDGWKYITYGDGALGYVDGSYLAEYVEPAVPEAPKITIIDSANNHFVPVGDFRVIVGSVD